MYINTKTEVSHPIVYSVVYWLHYACVPKFFFSLNVLSNCTERKVCVYFFTELLSLFWNSVAKSASELYQPSESRLSAKLELTFKDRRFHVVSVTDSNGRILYFLDRNRYFFFQVAPQLYSRGCVDPVPDPLLRTSGNAANRIRTSGSVARNSDH
jgi:hypothetical protein